MSKDPHFTGPYWTMRKLKWSTMHQGKQKYHVYQGWMEDGQLLFEKEQLLGIVETEREGYALMAGLHIGADQLSVDEHFFKDPAGHTLVGLSSKVGIYNPRDFEDMQRQTREFAEAARAKEGEEAEQIAMMADAGKDISHFFTNDGKMKPPVAAVLHEELVGVEDAKPEIKALYKLHLAGAHFTIAHDKRPINKHWLTTRLEFDRVVDGYQDGYRIGIIPSTIGCLVIDIDQMSGTDTEELKQEVITSLGPPLCEVQTPAAGFHLYYRCKENDDLGLQNHWWRPKDNPNTISGSIVHSYGYVILWDILKVADSFTEIERHEFVNTDLWPLTNMTNGGRE